MLLLLALLTFTATTLLFTLTKHPLAMIATLLMQTLVVSWAMLYISLHSLYSYALFLIFMGAMMVLFVYIGVLASNEMFTPQLSPMKLTLTFIFSVIMTLMSLTVTSLGLWPTATTTHSPTPHTDEPTITMAEALWTQPNMSVILFIISFLLLTLVVAVEITNNLQGPLRNLS